MESQPKIPEFRNNPKKNHPCSDSMKQPELVTYCLHTSEKCRHLQLSYQLAVSVNTKDMGESSKLPKS